MSSIKRSDFVSKNSNKSLDLDSLRDNAAAKQRLNQAGSSASDIARADLNRDGKISGRVEMDALFSRADRFDTNGLRDSLIDTDRHGAQTPAGKVLSTLGLLLENKDPDPPFAINGTVGPNGRNNHDDVMAVQKALGEQGFNISADGQWGRKTQTALRIFATQYNGNEQIKDSDINLSPGSPLAQALAERKEPIWVSMPRSGTGFVNVDTDGFSWGSARTAQVIKDAGQRYQNNYLSTHPDATPISVNDVSRKNGGVTADHDSHQAGLDMDLRLPRKDGGSGTRTNWRSYDHQAAYHMVKALAEDPHVERIILTDPTILQQIADSDVAWADKVVAGGNLHKNHMHVDIAPYDE